MGISGGGKKRKGFHRTPDTGGLYGMPGRYAPGTIEANMDAYDSRGRKVLAGTSDMNSLAGMPDTGRMNGMPPTNRMNGGWGGRHPGRMENRSGSTFTSGEENAERTKANWRTKDERRAERDLKALLDDKREMRVRDPHADDDLGKLKLNKGGELKFMGEHLMPNGSLAVATDGLCLKGEDQGSRTTMSETARYVYSDMEGAKKWRSVEEVLADVQEVSDGGMFAWNAKNKTMGPGGAMVGREWVEASGTGAKGDGSYWLMVTFTDDGATAQVVTGKGSKSDTTCYLPIYTISDGKVKKDLRGAFVVPCWE